MEIKSPGMMCLIAVATATLIGHLASAGQFELTNPLGTPSASRAVNAIAQLPGLASVAALTAKVDPDIHARPQTDYSVVTPEPAVEQLEPIDYTLFTRLRTAKDGNFTEESLLLDFQAILQPAGFFRPAWQNTAMSSRRVQFSPLVEPFVVMIDPGHGGTDPGAIGDNGLVEKDLTLDIARRVRLFLTEVSQIDVRLTRNHDYGLSRKARVNAIRRAEADLVISLHFNHLPQTQVNLVESYYASPQNIKRSLSLQHGQGKSYKVSHAAGRDPDFSFSQKSELAAQTLQQHLYSEVKYADKTAVNAGIKEKSLFVLTQSFTPGVLMEISCLSHAGEAERLTSDDYRNRLAAALVDGIRSYYENVELESLAENALGGTIADPGV